MSNRRVAVVLAALGGAGLAACVWASASSGALTALVPVALAASWWLAGLLALRARPDHASARLLTAVGSCHLAAFGVAAVIGVRAADRVSWQVWGAAVLANVVYALGFAALAALFASFPDERLHGRGQWAIAGLAVAAAVVAPVLAALTSPRTDLALDVRRAAVSPPGALPVGGHAIDFSAAVPALVVVGLGALVVRTWRARAERRRQLLWPVSVAATLVLMLAATPLGTHVLGRAWALVFIPIVGALPFALLAGVRRYRLLQVELYAGRTLAYGGVLVVVLSVYAAAAALAGHNGALPAVAVAGVAALTGHRLSTSLEGVADRVLSGGRLRGHALVRHFAESLVTTDGPALAARAADTISAGLDVAWIEIRCQPSVHAHAGGPPDALPRLVVPLIAGGKEIGTIACGPRRGGWSDEDVRLLTVLARHAALALHGADLTAALARRVAELTASRERLVRAEDDVRRRLERDLHDGIQQQLVVLLARLEMLRSMLDLESPAGKVAAQSHEQAGRSLAELRNLVRGIHPPLLSDRGVVAAIEAQADLLPIPVTVDVDPRVEDTRFPAPVETAAYYVVCEATTNVIKHSGASRARIVVTPTADGGLQVAVADEGAGFVADRGGSGIKGLRDRVEAVGGTLDISSTVGLGTTVVARFPVKVLTDA